LTVKLFVWESWYHRNALNRSDLLLFTKFDAICRTDELKWQGTKQQSSYLAIKYNMLLTAIQPFLEAAKYIPENASPNEDISVIPQSCFCIGDFYKLIDALKGGCYGSGKAK
jgi:hypothetical protein